MSADARWWHPSRLRGTNPLLVDSAFAAFVGLFGLLTLAGGEAHTYAARPTDAFAYGLTVAGFGALAFRRIRPLASFLVVLAATTCFTALEYVENGLPLAG